MRSHPRLHVDFNETFPEGTVDLRPAQDDLDRIDKGSRDGLRVILWDDTAPEMEAVLRFDAHRDMWVAVPTSICPLCPYCGLPWLDSIHEVLKELPAGHKDRIIVFGYSLPARGATAKNKCRHCRKVVLHRRSSTDEEALEQTIQPAWWQFWWWGGPGK